MPSPNDPDRRGAPSTGSASADDNTGSADVAVVEWKGDDARLLQLARQKSPVVAGALYDRFGPLINRLVWRLLGADGEHDDIVHQVFIQIVQNVAKVRDPKSLRGWVSAVTVNTVRTQLRRRNLRRAFHVFDHDATTVALAPAPDYAARELLESTYDVLGKMPATERIAFTLYHIDKRKLTEVAEMCGCSLATIKRRIAKADRRFCKMANRDPVLAERVRESPLARKIDLHE